MTHLQSCYFCGTTGALSAYELPAGTDGAPLRMTLCTRCHTKLTNVLTSVLDQSGDLSRADGPEQTRLPSAGDTGADETGTDDDHQTTDEAATQPEVTFSSADADEHPDEEAAEDDDSSASVDTESDAAAEFDADSTAAATAEDASAADVDDATEGDGDTDATPEGGAAERGAGDAEAADEDTDAADENTETTVSAEDTTGGATAPDGDDEFPAELERVYHKLLRFLRNREFPIPRGEAETVAQSAYDLTEREASQVIQRAVDKGVLEERDGELHRN